MFIRSKTVTKVLGMYFVLYEKRTIRFEAIDETKSSENDDTDRGNGSSSDEQQRKTTNGELKKML